LNPFFNQLGCFDYNCPATSNANQLPKFSMECLTGSLVQLVLNSSHETNIASMLPLITRLRQCSRAMLVAVRLLVE